jgi:hypothetical protein
LPEAHEELVVTAVVVPEFEELDDVPDVEEPDVEALEDDPELGDLPVADATFAAFAAAAFARAGSLPVTSCAKIPPELARNNAVANATTRLRIALIRCLRARSRSATRSFAPDPAAERGTARPATGTGRALLEGSTAAIVTSNFSWAECSTQTHRPVSQSRESRIRKI